MSLSSNDPLTIDVRLNLPLMGMAPDLFFKSGNTSFRGPCPKCGGNRRLVVFINGPFPKWFAKCDLCWFSGWAYTINPALAKDLDPSSFDDAPPVSVKTHDDPKIQGILERIEASGEIEKANAGMTKENRKQWSDWGVPDDLQDFWRLGFVKSRIVNSRVKGVNLAEYPAYTIPKYGLGWSLRNIDFRLMDTPPGEGKYRFLPIPPAPFISRPDLDQLHNHGVAYIVEGSKKAMVTSIMLDRAQVIGLPSVDSWAGISDQLEGCEIIYVILDPDGWSKARKLCKRIGPAARQVTLPEKIDDSILSGALTRDGFNRILAYSRRVVTASTSEPTEEGDEPNEDISTQ